MRVVCVMSAFRCGEKLTELAAMYGSKHTVLLKLIDIVDETLKGWYKLWQG